MAAIPIITQVAFLWAVRLVNFSMPMAAIALIVKCLPILFVMVAVQSGMESVLMPRLVPVLMFAMPQLAFVPLLRVHRLRLTMPLPALV
jgi:hypothetical protein